MLVHRKDYDFNNNINISNLVSKSFKSQGPDSNRSGNALQAFAWPLRHLGTNNIIRQYRRSDLNLYRLRASDDAKSAKISSAIKIAFEARTIFLKQTCSLNNSYSQILTASILSIDLFARMAISSGTLTRGSRVCSARRTLSRLVFFIFWQTAISLRG